MRILLTVHQFVPDYFSGTEILAFSVAKEFLRRGHDVSVFTGYPAREHLSDSQRFDNYTIEGINVYRLHHANVPMGNQRVVSEIEYDNHLSAEYFALLIDNFSPDIIHFFHFHRLGISLIDVARQKAVPAYFTPTDFWTVCPTSQLSLGNGEFCEGPTKHGGNCIKHVAALTRWRKRAALIKYLPDSVADAVAMTTKSGMFSSVPYSHEIAALSCRRSFTMSRLNMLQGVVSPALFMTKILTDNGLNKSLVVQSAFGLDLSGFENVTEKTISHRALSIGYIGTLAHHKGCHVLIDAFLRLETKDIILKIYGNTTEFPDYYNELKKLAGNCVRIEFHGTFPNKQIANVLAGLDVIVVPSLWYENTPLVIYSALAAKCPVIASNFPGMSEVVRDGWNGMTFQPGNSMSLKACLERLIGNPKFLQELSGNCNKPKSISSYVDELLALYRQK